MYIEQAKRQSGSKMMRRIVLSVIFICLILCSLVWAESYMLVVPNTPPGGVIGSNPVLRFLFEGTGALHELSEIPAELVNDPESAAFKTSGELFISNRHGLVSGDGSISRFIFDENLDFIPNGIITGNSLNGVTCLAFSPGGELFAGNAGYGPISRFLFAADGTAIPNGLINIPGSYAISAMTFNQDGDLFVTDWYKKLTRFSFDQAGQATLTGTFPIPAARRPHGIVFNPQGELFVCAPDEHRVLRFFVGSDTLTPHGQISIPGFPIGATFSPEGELFVTEHYSGGIYRFLFNSDGTAYSNGNIPTVNLGIPAISSVYIVPANQNPVADAGGPYLVAVDDSIVLNGSGSTDPDGDPLTYMWTQVENLGVFTYPTDENPIYTGTYAGITNLTLTVSDGQEHDADTTMLVVYDSDGGFVTGGGWIDSQPGDYVPNPALEGQANFGFVSKYKKGVTVPTGNTEFVFQAGDLNFHSSSYDWLVVTGSDYARFKGSGTINGTGDYKFMLWAGDDEPDTFRIRIWTEDEVSGEETVIYDNGSDQAIGGGSIIVHAK